jgi:hypothetical protein
MVFPVKYNKEALHTCRAFLFVLIKTYICYMEKMTLQEIYDKFPEDKFLIYDGLEDAIIGVDDSSPKRLIMSHAKTLDILMNDGLTYEEAVEHIDFNVRGGYVGLKTPLWLDDLLIEDGETPEVVDDWEEAFSIKRNNEDE